MNNTNYIYNFTVFTPSYNRRHTLHRVYESLKQQTFKNFEWIVVDDGSSDNTEKLVKSWQQEGLFPIVYFYQENAGKHNAINKGVELAKGEFFVIADSDDSFVPNALQIFYDTWQFIPLQDRSQFAGVWTLCKDEQGNLIPDSYPISPWDCTIKDRFIEHNITGEKWHMERTDIMAEFPFPSIKIKGFYYGEGNIWLKMNKKYKFRCINEPLRIYHKTDEGIMGTMSKDRRLGQLALYHGMLSTMSDTIEYFFYRPKYFIVSMVLLQKYSIDLKIPLSATFDALPSLKMKFLFVVVLPLLPIAFLLFWLKQLSN